MVSILSILFALLLSLTIPGLAFLAITDALATWSQTQRWIVAIAISIATYPICFYIGWLFPQVTLGPAAIVLGLMLCVITLLIMKGKELFRLALPLSFQKLAILIIFPGTLATRFWIAAQNPFPAWTDSVHHVILAKLIATQGRLPTTLEPYFPISLNMYHLGLHTIAAVVVWLSQSTPHAALFWTAQTFNGLCGLGVFLVLDRKVGRVAAISGAIVVGLLSYQPAFYVNWGRFTQVAGQALLLIAWLVTDEAILVSTKHPRVTFKEWLTLCLLAAFLIAGMSMLHFRVIAFYLMLTLPTMIYRCWQHRRTIANLRAMVLSSMLITTSAMILVIPSLFPALTKFLQFAASSAPRTISPAQQIESQQAYYHTTLQAIVELAAQPWLWWFVLGSLVIGIYRRNKMIFLAVVWIVFLSMLGNLYRLGIRSLNVVNMTGTAIMFYLPIGLIIGSASQEIADALSPKFSKKLASTLFLVFMIASLLFAVERIQRVEPYRYFMTAGDENAFTWIKNSLPSKVRFAVNTNFWLPTTPHGTDGGYWIPYATEREITAGSMLLNLADQTYQNQVIEESRLVSQLNDSESVLVELYNRGVHYVYIGVKGHYTPGKGLDAQRLKGYQQLQVIYEKDGVTIFEILPPPT